MPSDVVTTTFDANDGAFQSAARRVREAMGGIEHASQAAAAGVKGIESAFSGPASSGIKAEKASEFANVLRSKEIDAALNELVTKVTKFFGDAIQAGFKSGIKDLGEKTFLAGPKSKGIWDFLFPEFTPLNKGWEQTTPGAMPTPAPAAPQQSAAAGDNNSVPVLNDILNVLKLVFTGAGG